MGQGRLIPLLGADRIVVKMARVPDTVRPPMIIMWAGRAFAVSPGGDYIETQIVNIQD